jgi:hypothetical protein
LEIFDATKVNFSLWDNRKFMKKKHGDASSKKQAPCGPISTLAYSETLDAIAYAGVKGYIYMMDTRT